MRSNRIQKVLSHKGMVSLVLDIASLVVAAYGDQAFGLPGESPIGKKARELMGSLRPEEMRRWILLMEVFVRSRKLRFGEVKTLLGFERASFPVSLDAPERPDSERTLHDVLPTEEDFDDHMAQKCDSAHLRRAIWNRATAVGLSGDERRFLDMILGRDMNLFDIATAGFSVERKARNGGCLQRELSREDIRQMHATILRKLRCPELRGFLECS